MGSSQAQGLRGVSSVANSPEEQGCNCNSTLFQAGVPTGRMSRHCDTSGSYKVGTFSSWNISKLEHLKSNPLQHLTPPKVNTPSTNITTYGLKCRSMSSPPPTPQYRLRPRPSTCNVEDANVDVDVDDDTDVDVDVEHDKNEVAQHDVDEPSGNNTLDDLILQIKDLCHDARHNEGKLAGR